MLLFGILIGVLDSFAWSIHYVFCDDVRLSVTTCNRSAHY